ncbi:YIPF1-like protein, partial [Trifolium pratense]
SSVVINAELDREDHSSIPATTIERRPESLDVRTDPRTKYCTVAEMGALGWGADGRAWVWRRQLRAWEEEMLGECQALLSNISLQAISLDMWQWQP